MGTYFASWNIIPSANRERANGIVSMRFLPSGDVRAYCDDGDTYLIASYRRAIQRSPQRVAKRVELETSERHSLQLSFAA